METQEQGDREMDEEHHSRDGGTRAGREGFTVIAIEVQEQMDLDRRTGKTMEVERQ